jgi:hypothetical protein
LGFAVRVVVGRASNNVENEGMRKRNRFRNYLSIEALVIVLVIISFRFIPDKKMASILTSLLFIGSSAGILFWETKFSDFKKRPSFWGALGFLLLSALPVFGMRLLNWDIPFDEIQIAGVTGAQMHKASNYVFMLMMACFFVDSYLQQVKDRESES